MSARAEEVREGRENMSKDAEVTSVYLSVDKEGFEKTKEEAFKNAKESYGDDCGESFLYDTEAVAFQTSEAYIDDDDGELKISGQITSKKTGDDIAYVSFTIRLGNEAVIDVIKNAVGLYNKVKTVLEASK